MKMTKKSVAQRLKKLTYVIEHTPNVELRYLVRLHGVGKGLIDKKPLRETKDIVGRGKSIFKAAKEAVKKREILFKKKYKSFSTKVQ